MSGIKINNSNESVVKEYPIFVGVSKVKVVALNPTLKELNDLGLNFNQEPEYVGTTDTGEEKVRLDFFVQNEKLTTKVSFFLEDRDRVSKSGNFQIVNNLAQSTWAGSVEEATARVGRNGNTWFNENGARVARVGEVDLLGFLSDWLNVNPQDEVVIQDMSKLFKGDVSELRQYVKAAVENEVYVLFIAKTTDSGKTYQNTHSEIFARGSMSIATATSRFSKHVAEKAKAGYEVKGFAGLEFKEYIPTSVDIPNSPDPDISTSNSDVVSF